MGESLAPLKRAALWRAAALGLWALVLLRSAVDGRLDLLLRAVFHPLVGVAGGLLLALALLQLALGLGLGPGGRDPARSGAFERIRRRQALLLPATAAVAALLLALPPAPSFADLAGQRPRDDTAASELSFVLPPAQRTLTDWVRLLRSQPDPR
ncbi:MAG: TIGR03943 family protein, partial [Synechococcaceae cyanobacterium]|nr:TIGR03943 family protein [Synechococcaceae cyanobacterium]